MVGLRRLIRVAGTRMAGCVLMMPQRHALRRHHRSHALQRHDQGNQQREKANETRIHSGGFYMRSSTRMFQSGSPGNVAPKGSKGLTVPDWFPRLMAT